MFNNNKQPNAIDFPQNSVLYIINYSTGLTILRTLSIY